MTRPDIQFEDHGTLVLFRASSALGRAWVRDHVNEVPQYTMVHAGWIAADHRPAQSILRGALLDGLKVETTRATPN